MTKGSGLLAVQWGRKDPSSPGQCGQHMWGLLQGRPSLHRGLQDKGKGGGSATMRSKYTSEIITSTWRRAYKIQDGFLEEAGFVLSFKE